jgi:bifunctional DNA-binding transcriptional regulator/antitoxin component of YhaV-PrlF toxin-antitoxin module
MENILSVDLSSETSPVVQEVRGREYIEYGTEHWKNLYPQFLIDLYYNSSTHAAIINTTAEMIAGEDIIVDENENLEQFVKLKKFFAEANGKETLHEVIKKISFDFKLQGAFALHIIWNRAKTEIAEIHHVPVERVRAAKPNAMGKVDCYYVCADWSNTRTNKPMKLAAFNTKDRTNPSQLLYTGLYSPNMDIYHTPDYLAANNWALVDQRVAEFHLNNISNGFSGSYMISFANGVPTQEERFQIERSLAEKFTGASNSGKFVLTFSDDKTRTPEITPITVSNADKQYLALQELLVQNILTGHRVTSPMLMGIKNDTGLGSNVDEMNAAFEIYLNTVVIPFQKHIVKTLAKIFEVNGINIPFSFVQAKPITSKFTIEDMKEVMTEDEIREELGLKPLTDEELTAEDEDNYNLEKVGSIVSDGKELPLFDSIEEAEAEAEKLGCSGHHIHTQDGKEYFMPCANHDQLINLKDCDCGKNKDKCDKSCYEKTELDAFLETVEDIPEGWELIDEEVVDGEHADFDFEEELNQIASEKVELATTGVARPDSKSEQDGISKKTYDYYRVRYIYAQDNFLTRKSGKKRDFCEKMMAAKKLYRKEDIARMSTKRVNPGWGKGGADTYDIFLYKGGGNCHHFWLRQIYRTELGISVSTKIKDADLVGYTKARSEGFTAKRNDKRVAIAPKRMKNNGFVKKR